jgi:hypothetical protein
MMLAEQRGRIASMSPEGGVFDLMAGLYSKSGMPQFDVYLKGHSGDDLITDRVTRNSVRVSHPALTCAYTIQPQVIKGLAENPAFRGRGLLARFLYAFPESWIGHREIAPAPMPEETNQAYHRMVKAVARNTADTVLQLTAEASTVFRDWEAEIETMLADGGALENMRDWGGKLAGATLRLAAVMHWFTRGREDNIAATAIRAAITIARYLIPHAEAVLNMMQANTGPSDDDAQYVLSWIQRHGRRQFTKSEAQHHGKRRFPKAQDIDPVLQTLVSRGYIRPIPAALSGPGRPSSPVFEVNPTVFADSSPEVHPRSSNDLTEPSKHDNSGNNGNGFAQNKKNVEFMLAHNSSKQKTLTAYLRREGKLGSG